MAAKILIVDDEKNIVNILRFNLEKEGYETILAYDGQEALNMVFSKKPDLILLDVMLPVFDGFTVCRKIREKSQVPIIMLTAKEEELDKVLGLELGADDYVTKPFSPRELLARIKSNLRRHDFNNTLTIPKVTKIYDLEIDESKYEVRKDGKLIELTSREFELLLYLVKEIGNVISREKLLETIWNYDYYGDMRTVDVTISRLRDKLSNDTNQYIITKRGKGYFFRREE